MSHKQPTAAGEGAPCPCPPSAHPPLCRSSPTTPKPAGCRICWAMLGPAFILQHPLLPLPTSRDHSQKKLLSQVVPSAQRYLPFSSSTLQAKVRPTRPSMPKWLKPGQKEGRRGEGTVGCGLAPTEALPRTRHPTAVPVKLGLLLGRQQHQWQNDS